MTKITTGLAIAALLTATGAAAAPAPESHYTTLRNADCTVVESGEPEGQDWLLYRCEGASNIAVWVLYQDSTRMMIAFGPKPVDGIAGYSSDRDEAWKVEWRAPAKGLFQPYAAILRMRPAGGGDSILAVYRVWPDKPSCLLGTATNNETARQIADAGATATGCAS